MNVSHSVLDATGHFVLGEKHTVASIWDVHVKSAWSPILHVHNAFY